MPVSGAWSGCAILAALTLALVARAGHADDTICNGVLGAASRENVVVPDRADCTLRGTRVDGNIKVMTGATLRADAVVVGGNIQSESAAGVFVNPGSSVGGSIQVKQGGAATIDGVAIGGDLQFEENRGPLVAIRNVVDGNLQAVQNTGGLTIADNRIRENLQCKENRPAPTGGGNVAGDAEDQCAALQPGARPAPGGIDPVCGPGEMSRPVRRALDAKLVRAERLLWKAARVKRPARARRLQRRAARSLAASVVKAERAVQAGVLSRMCQESLIQHVARLTQ
jgi:hypothetical protein